MAVSYDFSQLAKAFVLGKLFQSSLMFADEAGAYLSVAPFRCSTPGLAPLPCPQTLD